MNAVVQKIAKEYKSRLKALYGDDLVELVLFGSYARGDEHEESDVDFAIVLRNPDTRTTAELFKTSHIASRLSLEHGLIVSSLPVSLQKKESSMQGVYQNIRKEGICV